MRPCWGATIRKPSRPIPAVLTRLVQLGVVGAALIGATGLPQSTTPAPRATPATAPQAGGKAKPKTSSAKATAKSKKKAASKRRTLTAAQRAALAKRAQRAHRAFVASALLRPMAQQLLENRSTAAYAGLESFARRHASEDAGALAYLVLGYARLVDHDFPAAIPNLKRAQAHAGELADYADYFLASCYAGAGLSQQATALLHDFASRHPDSLFLRDAAVLDANTRLASGDAKGAIAALLPYRTPYRPELELLLGRAYLHADETGKGIEVLRRIYYTAPASDSADAAGRELQDHTPADTPPPSLADRTQRASLLLGARRFQDAAKEYRSLLAGAEASTQTELQMNLATALYRGGSRAAAQEVLQKVPDVAGDLSARRDYYLLEMARSAGDEDGVRRLLEQLRTTAPSSSALQDALLSAGNMYLLRHDTETAAQYYREISARFPASRGASYAHWKATWLFLRLGRIDDARQMLDEHLRLYPASAEIPAVLYWRGRLAEDDKDLGRARAYYRKLSERFRFYYYADLARDRLKEIKLDEVTDDPALAQIPDPPPVAALAAEAPADNIRLQRSLLLHNGGLTDFAVHELEQAQAEGSAPWVPREIAQIYLEAGQYNRALQLLKRVVPSYFAQELASLPRAYWEGLFPRPWWDDLRRSAVDHGLDPFLVASLIRQESEFNPNAISPANARGLMQILPSVGSHLAREEKLPRFSTDQLLTPATNLRLGTRYFKELLDKYDGQVEYALAAYNAGEDRVEEWRNSGHYRDMAEFVESIPFTETREYVQAILRNTRVYRRLYGQP